MDRHSCGTLKSQTGAQRNENDNDFDDKSGAPKVVVGLKVDRQVKEIIFALGLAIPKRGTSERKKDAQNADLGHLGPSHHM